MSEQQLSMFPSPSPSSNTLVGVRVLLDRPIDRERPCHQNICVIKLGKAMHAGALHCASCGQFRGWLSKATGDFIKRTIEHFGKLDAPIVVRKAHTFEELPTVAGADSGMDHSAPYVRRGMLRSVARTRPRPWRWRPASQRR